MNRPLKPLLAIHRHAAASGSEMRMIVCAVEDVVYTGPFGDRTEKTSHIALRLNIGFENAKLVKSGETASNKSDFSDFFSLLCVSCAF